MDWSSEDAISNGSKSTEKKSNHSFSVFKKHITKKTTTTKSFQYCLPEDLKGATPLASNAPKNTKNRNSKKKIIEDFIVQEGAYLWDLQLIRDYFSEPLKDTNIISLSQFTDIFGSLPNLIDKTSNFVTDLTDMKDTKNIGKTLLYHFTEISPALIDYCCKKVISLDTLTSLLDTNDNFEKYVSKKQSDSVTCDVTLKHLLESPISRLQFYINFSKEILLLTPKNQTDCKDIEKSIQLLIKAKSSIDVMSKESEKAVRVKHLKNIIDVKDIVYLSNYSFILDSDVSVTDSNGNIEDWHLILLSKTLLFTQDTFGKNRKRSLIVKRNVYLIYIDLLTSKENNPFCISLRMFGDVYVLKFISKELKSKWETALKDSIFKEVKETAKKMNFGPYSKHNITTRKLKKKPAETTDDLPKLESLLKENTKLSQQLAKITFSKCSTPKILSPGSPARKRSQASTPRFVPKEVVEDNFKIFIFYGPKFTGKTELAKYFITHCRKQNIKCAYLKEEQFQYSYYDANQKDSITSFDISKILIEAVLKLKKNNYKYIIIDGSFSNETSLPDITYVIEELSLKYLICCCYAPYSIRQQRNEKSIQSPQCKPFLLPSNGLFVDTTNSAEDIFITQILPLV